MTGLEEHILFDPDNDCGSNKDNDCFYTFPFITLLTAVQADRLSQRIHYLMYICITGSFMTPIKTVRSKSPGSKTVSVMM